MVLWTGVIEHLVVGRVVSLPGGVWDVLVVQDTHVKIVDIVAAQVGAWVHLEVVFQCPDFACAVAASECVLWTLGLNGQYPGRIDGSKLHGAGCKCACNHGSELCQAIGTAILMG